MDNFSHNFTGKNTAINLPTGEGVQRAQEGLNAIVEKVANIKYQTWKENREQFLKDAKIDPMFVLSDKAMREQMEQINAFNETWGKVAQETNYNLSDKQKLDFQTHKNLIIARAQDAVSTMERFKQHQKLVQDHPELFDPVGHAKDYEIYEKTGDYNRTLPPYKEIDFGMFAEAEADKRSFVFDEHEKDLGNGLEATEAFNMPEGYEGKFLGTLLGKDPRADKNFFRRWDEADKEHYFKLADANRDNKVSKEEEQNAIVLWAKDTFPNIRKSIQQGKRVKAGYGEKATSGVSPVNVANAQVKLSPGTRAPDRSYGDQTYSKFSFGFGGNTPIYGIPTKNGKVLQGDYPPEDIDRGNANGRLILYDPIKHVFVMELSTGSESTGTKTTTLLEIPETNVPNFGNIPVMVAGEKMTIGNTTKLLAAEYDEEYTNKPVQSESTQIAPTETKKARPY
jgi:hypothetical protein